MIEFFLWELREKNFNGVCLLLIFSDGEAFFSVGEAFSYSAWR